MRKAVYPGSFDPVTFGHIDIIQRMAKQYDEFTVLVANSLAKHYLFSEDERVKLIREALGDIPSVKVQSFSGLTVDYAQQIGAESIVRGLRAVSDFEYEMAMANMNKSLCSSVETLIVFSDPKLNFVSSRMVKEVAKLGGDLTNLIPDNVVKALNSKFK